MTSHLFDIYSIIAMLRCCHLLGIFYVHIFYQLCIQNNFQLLLKYERDSALFFLINFG